MAPWIAAGVFILIAIALAADVAFYVRRTLARQPRGLARDVIEGLLGAEEFLIVACVLIAALILAPQFIF